MNSSSIGMDVAATNPETLSFGELFSALWRRKFLMIGVPLLASAIGLGVSYLVAPTFTARVSFLPPQQPQSAAASTLATLGALAGAAAGGAKTSGDQYVALAQSTTVADRLVERFDLVNRYDKHFKVDARTRLAANTRIALGRKDGLITLEVDDEDPKTSAAMASAYIEELRQLTARLALTEAQQRRAFFERQLKQVRDKLTEAQQALSGTGINAGALKAEPKATAEGFAKLKAELTAAEVKLQVLKQAMADGAAEVVAQTALVGGLRAEVAKLGQSEASGNQNSYVTAYREFKYQETLFDLIARQYEVAKIDESRDGGQLQVVDEALVPERKSKPKRSIFVLVAFGLGLALAAAFVLSREFAAKKRRPA